jgi:hypothetical protein
MQQHNEVELSALGMGNVAFRYIHISENLFILFSSFPKLPLSLIFNSPGNQMAQLCNPMSVCKYMYIRRNCEMFISELVNSD